MAMVEDPTESKPSREQVVADVLRLGELLHQHAFPQSDLGLTRPIRPHEASRLRSEIEAIGKRIETAVYDTNQRLLRSLLDIRGNQVLGDHIALRIIAYVAWSSLTTERSGASLARVATAVSLGDMAGHVEARRAIRMLVGGKRDAICYKDSDYSGGELLPAYKLSKFLSNDQIPILWNEEGLQKDRDEWERKKIAESHKPASSPRQVEPPPSAQKPIESLNLLTARGIFNALKDDVIAIDAPLLRFCGQMSLHMRRLEQIRKGVRPSVGPIVTLLIGSSGSGKTWMAENFAKVSGLPFAVADMSGVSQASYVGLSVDECFFGLLANKTKIIDAQKGIVVWDEFDKLCAKDGGSHSSSDPQGRGCQAELLKPLDGCKLPLGSRRSNSPYFGVLDTYETCFVLAGAFEGLRELLAEGNRKSSGLGFGSAEAKNPRSDIRDALVRYGFMAQIINRIGSIILLPDLIPEQIVRIITHPNGLLAKQNAFLGSFGMKLDMTEEAIQHLSHWACETKGYSRAVKSILGALVERHLYDDKASDINIWLADVKKAINETESSEHLGM